MDISAYQLKIIASYTERKMTPPTLYKNVTKMLK